MITEIVENLQYQIEALETIISNSAGKVNQPNYRRMEKARYELVEARNRLIIADYELEHER